MSSVPTHYIEVTVHATSTEDKNALREFLADVSKADSSFTFRIDGRSGGAILQGVSEPHLDLIIETLQQKLKTNINRSIPGIVYRSGPAIEGGKVMRLEPIMRVAVTIPSEYSGAIREGLCSRHGVITDDVVEAEVTIIKAMVPLSKLFGFSDVLTSLAQNTASCEVNFGHYGPAHERVVSKLGIFFTTESVINMRQFAAEIPLNQETVLLWRIQRDPQGQLKIGLGASHAPTEQYYTGIEDQVDGIVFYWRTKESDLDELRAKYSIYWERRQKMRVIPLTPPSDK